MTENTESKNNRTVNQVIERLVGEIERLKIYAEKGDIIKQEIPPDIEIAAEKLISLMKDNDV